MVTCPRFATEFTIEHADKEPTARLVKVAVVRQEGLQERPALEVRLSWMDAWKLQNEAGTAPIRRFWAKLRYVRDLKPPKEAGIVPVRLLSPNPKAFSAVSARRLLGMDPCRELTLRVRNLRDFIAMTIFRNIQIFY
jgi:hypothetical protein